MRALRTTRSSTNCSSFPTKPLSILDDIGRNLKSARALGMTTIKVDEPESALRELEQVLGFGLLQAGPAACSST